MRQGAALRVLDVLQQAARSRYRDRLISAAKAVQIADPELSTQRAKGAIAVEMPRCPPPQTRMFAPAFGWATILIDQQFGGFQPFQFVA